MQRSSKHSTSSGRAMRAHGAMGLTADGRSGATAANLAPRHSARGRASHSMSDIIDQAGEIEELHRAAALARQQARPVGTGTADCIDCDAPIPAARRRALPPRTGVSG